MNLIYILLALTTFLTTVLCQDADVKNTTREFQLKTTIKPGHPGKERYNNLWLAAYHTGAGLDDALMINNRSSAIKGFLNGTLGGVFCPTCNCK